MQKIIDIEQLGYETVRLEAATPDAGGAEAVLPAQAVIHASPGCSACAMYSPAPQLSGNLQVDPEIHLPSPGMDVEIGYFYNSFSTANGPFGYGRTLSTNLTAQAAGSPLIVSMTRGNGTVVTYQADGGGFISYSPENLNILEQDTLNGLWKETTTDGQVMAYPLDTNGAVTTISYARDAVGNRHTFTYSDGRLQTLQEVMGRKVSFSYEENGLLETIQDWAGRRTTFQYDTASIPGAPVLTTVIGPSGCQTGYGYENAEGIPRLTRVTDPNGYDTTYTFDAVGRVTQRSLAGDVTSYRYEAGQTSVAQPMGGVMTHALDDQWRPVEIVDATGVALSFTRNERNQETMRQDNSGAVTTTTYDAAGLPSATIDPLGRITTYQRDAYGNATTMVYADGTITSMIYGYPGSSFDATGAKRTLQVSVDQLGNRTSYTYNGRGQVRSIQDPLGYRTTYGYDGWGNQNTVTDALGYVTTLTYDLAGNVIATTDPLGHTTTVSYDAQNRPTKITNALGYVNTTAYDSVGNPVVRIDPLGRRTTISYNAFNKPVAILDMQGNRTTNVYDAQGRNIAIEDALGYRTSTVYDQAGRVLATVNALGHRTSTLYDNNGRLQSVVNALGYHITLIYDIAGRVIENIDPLGYVTTMVYDLVNRQIATVDKLGRKTTNIYDAEGRKIASIDALGYSTTTIYDATGRSVATVNPLGYSATLTFDAVGQVQSLQNILGNRTSFTYNANKQPIAITDPNNHIVTNSYDALNRLQSVQSPLGYITSYLYNASNEEIAICDALGYLHTKTYDSLERLQNNIDPLGNITTHIFNEVSQLIGIVNANGNVTSKCYDSVGLLISEIDARGYRTSFVYDEIGRQIAVINSNAQVYTSIYDARDNLLENINPLNYSVSYSYDAMSNLSQRIDARGIVTSYLYDAKNQLTNTIYPDNTKVTYAFDPIGQLVQMGDTTGITNYTYNMMGQRSGLSYPTGQRLTYSYDALGNRIALESTNGLTSYMYDVQSRLTEIVNPYSEITQIQYDGLDREVRKTLGNGVVVSQTYDAAGRKAVLEQHRSNGTAIAIYTATYDNIGNRAAAQELDGSFVTYIYDESNQLLREERTGSISYNNSFTYDGLGNRLTESKNGVITTYTYDANNAVMTAMADVTVTSYSYDANGNRTLVNAGGMLTTYTWDEENRMIGVFGSDIELFTYAGDGQRRSKNSAEGEVLYVWNEENILEELNENYELIAHYTDYPGYWGGLTSLFLAEANPSIPVVAGIGCFNGVQFNAVEFNQTEQSAQSGSFFYLFDQSSSTRYLLNSVEDITDSSFYTAFGEQVMAQGQTRNPYGFHAQVGAYTDSLNRIWMRARIYNAEVGQWYSADPVGFDGLDWNLYRFANNDPVNRADPSGLWSTPEECFNEHAKYYWDRTVHSSREVCEAAKKICRKKTGKKFSNIDCSKYPNTPREQSPDSKRVNPSTIPGYDFGNCIAKCKNAGGGGAKIAVCTARCTGTSPSSCPNIYCFIFPAQCPGGKAPCGDGTGTLDKMKCCDQVYYCCLMDNASSGTGIAGCVIKNDLCKKGVTGEDER